MSGPSVSALAGVSGMQTGDRHEFEVEVPAGAEFRATLVWYDPPGSLFSAGPVLVNDLDLDRATPDPSEKAISPRRH